MLSLRKETDYALQFIQYLGKDISKCHSLSKFAEDSDISFYFMQKIARKLSKAGIIKAEHGVNGGYRLDVNPKKLTLYRVIKIMEGGVRLAECVDKKEHECECNNKCRVKSIISKLNRDISKSMQNILVISD